MSFEAMQALLRMNRGERMRQLALIRLERMQAREGATDEQADEEAWQGLCEQFSELKNYDGCEL
jgi:hypothetical protein